MIALAADVQALIVWRFVQGLLLPSIFAVIDRLYRRRVAGGARSPASPASTSPGRASAGSAAASCTGVLADLIGWRGAFLALARSRSPARSRWRRCCRASATSCAPKGSPPRLRQMLRHLRNPQLLATYAVGFGTLFNFIAIFTYMSFLLAAPPYSFSSTLLGTIFVTYLVGTAITPMTGRAIQRLGTPAVHASRQLRGHGSAALLLTLAPPLVGDHRRAHALRRLRHALRRRSRPATSR